MGAASSRTQGAVRALPPGGLMYFGVLPKTMTNDERKI